MSIDPAGMRAFDTGRSFGREDREGEVQYLRTEIERLRADNLRLAEIETESWRQMKAELEQLRSERANRYWEGRWRDEKRDNERLRAELHNIGSQGLRLMARRALEEGK